MVYFDHYMVKMEYINILYNILSFMTTLGMFTTATGTI